MARQRKLSPERKELRNSVRLSVMMIVVNVKRIVTSTSLENILEFKSKVESIKQRMEMYVIKLK